MVWTVCPARLIRKPDLLAEHTDHSGETCRGVPADATARICAPSTLDLLRPAPPWGDHFDTHRPPLRRPCHSQLPAATCWSRAGEPLARSWSCNSPRSPLMKATPMLSGNVLAHATGALAPRERASSTCLFVHGSVLVALRRPTLARFADVPQRLAAQPGPLVFLTFHRQHGATKDPRSRPHTTGSRP